MVSGFLITLRETLEASLVVGLILSYLSRTKQTDFNRFVYAGIFAGLAASLAGAFLFIKLAGGFTGRAEQLFEGTVMLIGAFLLTTLILWIMKHRNVAKKVHGHVEDHLSKAGGWGLFFLVFTAILREGIETVIFLGAASFASGSDLIWSLGGVAVALLLGFLFFEGSMKVNLKTFFNMTNLLLVLFAAGLVAHGIHEFQEAGVIPIINEHLWDINPPTNLDGTYPALHENGAVGGFFKGLFGYNGNPSLIEVLSYIGYLVFAYLLWKTPKIGPQSI
ncbi:MAG: high-affinity iron transporter [Candidatus Altiarchaeota archaeon]|nr:high-affinity iron transporter [Candidatus Altiarchaeota archaeon]